jgi:hypothetical protein
VPESESAEDRAKGLSAAVAWGVLVEVVTAALHIGSHGTALGASVGTEGNWRERRLARRLQQLDHAT